MGTEAAQISWAASHSSCSLLPTLWQLPTLMILLISKNKMELICICLAVNTYWVGTLGETWEGLYSLFIAIPIVLITTVSISERHRQGSKCEIKFNNALIIMCTCLWWQQLWLVCLKMGRRENCHSSVKVEICRGGGGRGGSRGAGEGQQARQGRSQPRGVGVCRGVRAAKHIGGGSAALQNWMCSNSIFRNKQECTWT